MKNRRYTLEEAEQMSRQDRNRMIVLAVGAILIGGAYFMAQGRGEDEEEEDAGARRRAMLEEASRAPEQTVEIIPFDDTAALDEIQDATEEARLVIDAEPLVPVLAYSLLQTNAHFRAMGIEPLDADAAAAIAAAPGEHRLDALRVRGEVVDVERRRRAGGTFDDWLVTVRTADDTPAHLLFASAPKNESGERAVAIGDFIRLDGLFFKLLRREVEREWLEGPLVLGHGAVASLPPIDARIARAAPALADVVDDQVGAVVGVEEEALWQLMARATLDPAGTDWDGAPELDEATLARLYDNGDLFRGTAFRIPVSRNIDAWPQNADENALGIDRITEGWIGNAQWKNPIGIIKWQAPFEWPHLMRPDGTDPNTVQLIEARGWFLKNVVYTTGQGQPGRVPFFVLTDVEEFVPAEHPYADFLMYGVLGLTIVLVGLIALLLRADKRKSAQLQQELMRRKRARRERQALSSAPTA